MRLRLHKIFLAVLFSATSILTGCSTTERAQNVVERVDMTFYFNVADWINLNAMNASSPIQLFLIPLKNIDKFESIPGEELVVNLDNKLEDDLQGSIREIILTPGERLVTKWPAPCPGYVGILVNFRVPPSEEGGDRKVIVCSERSWTSWFGSPRSWQLDLGGNVIAIKPLKFMGFIN